MAPGMLDRWRRAEEALAKLTAIRARHPSATDYRADSDLRDIVERNFHVAIEAAIDLANELIAARGWRTPAGAREAFEVLAENGAFDRTRIASMSGWIGFRNLIVHGYANVDGGIVVRILETELDELRAHLVRLAASAGLVP